MSTKQNIEILDNIVEHELPSIYDDRYDNEDVRKSYYEQVVSVVEKFVLEELERDSV
jgi:hypothetical protein